MAFLETALLLGWALLKVMLVFVGILFLILLCLAFLKTYIKMFKRGKKLQHKSNGYSPTKEPTGNVQTTPRVVGGKQKTTQGKEDVH